MELKDLPFTQRMQIKEANLRGLYLSIACDIERALAHVITTCEEKDPQKREEYFWEKIVHLEFGKKVNKCKGAIKAHNSLYFEAHREHFITIQKFLKLRNMLTHGYSDFDPAKLDDTYIVFDWFDRPKKRIQKVDFQAQMAELGEYRRTLMDFMVLPIVLANEAGNNTPSQ